MKPGRKGRNDDLVQYVIIKIYQSKIFFSHVIIIALLYRDKELQKTCGALTDEHMDDLNLPG